MSASLWGKRATILIITALACFAAIFAPSLLAQSRAETDMVKSMVSRADTERVLLISLSQATDEETLNKIVAKRQAWSPIARMVIAMRLYQLNPKQGAEAVLRSLPRSDIEMEAFNEFSYEPQNSVLRPLYRAYYEAAFKSVVEHPEYLHAVFSVAREFSTTNWPDYDDIDWYCSNLAKVYKVMPDQYDRALLKEAPKNRVGLRDCGRGH
jgi:hypothetical protein